jgi:hypothetical protein
MSIADFHQKFVSATENNALVQSLRRLTLLEDPKLMFEGDPASEWAMWTPDGPAQA